MSIRRQIFATVRDVRTNALAEISVLIDVEDGDTFKFFAEKLVGTIEAAPQAICELYNDARFELLHIAGADVPDEPIEPSLPEEPDDGAPAKKGKKPTGPKPRTGSLLRSMDLETVTLEDALRLLRSRQVDYVAICGQERRDSPLITALIAGLPGATKLEVAGQYQAWRIPR